LVYVFVLCGDGLFAVAGGGMVSRLVDLVVSLEEGGREKGSCMTAVTVQRQDWGRGGRVLFGPLGKFVKDNSKRDWVEG